MIPNVLANEQNSLLDIPITQCCLFCSGYMWNIARLVPLIYLSVSMWGQRRGTIMLDALKRCLGILVGALLFTILTPAASLPNETSEQAVLEAYVTAAINTTQFMAAWRRIVEQANSEEQAAAFSTYVTHRIVAVIEDTTDITFAEYQDISKALKADPALKQQLSRIVKQRYGS